MHCQSPCCAADHLLDGLQVKAELNYSDLLTVTDMVCSTAFDRDDEFFATAGVFRRVKIFDFASVQDSDTSIHYPVLEIPSRLVADRPLFMHCHACCLPFYSSCTVLVIIAIVLVGLFCD